MPRISPRRNTGSRQSRSKDLIVALQGHFQPCDGMVNPILAIRHIEKPLIFLSRVRRFVIGQGETVHPVVVNMYLGGDFFAESARVRSSVFSAGTTASFIVCQRKAGGVCSSTSSSNEYSV